MLEILGIVLFALLIGISIALHELGHLIPAKRFGVKVTEYMIGFGPSLWTRQSGETRYGFKLFPLGGYIRMIGMIPPAKGDPPGTVRSMTTGRFATMIADARRASFEEVGPGDEDRVFYKLPVRKRIVVMLGGPVTNLVLAFVMFAGVLVGIGLPEPTRTVGDVVACTPTTDQPVVAPLPSGNCPVPSRPTPAVTAGLEPGDTIVAVDGAPVSTWTDITDVIWDRADTTVTLSVDRDGITRELAVPVAEITRAVYDEAGNPTGQTMTSGFVGVRPEFSYVAQPWSAVPAYMWDISVRSVQALLTLPVRLYELVAETLIGGGERALDGPVSVVGASRIGGEVAAMDEPLKAKVATFLGLAASLNLFLFLFNALPIVPLDGGHVASALYEGVRRRIARLRHRPDPGPVDTARLLPLTYAMAVVLVTMGVIVIWADLVKPISLG